MIIPKEVLAEKNYTGTRLIEITDPVVKKLQKEVASFKPKAEPWLKKLEAVSRIMDPARAKIRDIQEKAKKEVEAVKLSVGFEAMQKKETEIIEELDAIDQQATLVKNKMQPIINKIVKPQLGEFETAKQLTVDKEKMFVEVVDEIEEKVKEVRTKKANQK